MKRFHAAGICDCCDAPPEDEGENPNYGPGNPDWERDFEKDRSEGRLSPAPEPPSPSQEKRVTMTISQPTVATGGQDTSYRLWVNEARTVLFRLWASGAAEVAIRESPDHTWGPPVSMHPERA